MIRTRRVFVTSFTILLFGFLSMVLFFPTHIEADSKPYFKDIAAGHWSLEPVQELKDLGIIDGYQDGTFRPTDTLTREQFAKLLFMTLDLDLPKVEQPTFTDVSKQSWSFPYVESVKDYLEGYFPVVVKPFYSPLAPATREDVTVALVKALKLNVDEIENAEQLLKDRFVDYNKINPQLMKYVAVAVQNNIIKGFDDRTFRPQNSLSRAEAAALLQRLLKSPFAPPIDKIEFTVDIPNKTDKAKININGTYSSYTELYINETLMPNQRGSFNFDRELTKEGDNVFVFKAMKANGRSKTIEKVVNFTIPTPSLKMDIPKTTYTQRVKLDGELTDINDNNPKFWVNDTVINTYGGKWSINLDLVEGTNTLNFKALNKFGKEVNQTRTIYFELKAPELTIDIPDKVYTKKVELKVNAKDYNDPRPAIYINGYTVGYSSASSEVELTEGNNVFTIKATNKFGKVTETRKNVVFEILPPNITIDPNDDFSVFEKYELNVTAVDLNDAYPSLYLNGYYQGTGNFKYNTTLKEGENIFTIEAKNKFGKVNKIIKKVEFVILPPNLTIDPIPEVVTNKRLTITGSVTDFNDSYPVVYMNNKNIGTGKFSTTVDLEIGENTFVFYSKNSKGKTTTPIVKKVIYDIPAPTLTVDAETVTVSNNSFTLTASATDANDSSPELYLNGKRIALSRFSETVPLVEGENIFEIYAKNKYGKVSEKIIKIVIYQPQP